VSLGDHPVSPVVAVSDMEAAIEFYEGKLGLAVLGEDPDGGRTYSCGQGSAIHVYPAPDEVGDGRGTRAGWLVRGIEQLVDQLSSSGVEFEEYDGPLLRSGDRRITSAGGVHRAWFRDPDGNYLALTEITAAER
jgi:catechol 2,3-dioxygenase-like lactoylglutathione lyase family enzyme